MYKFYATQAYLGSSKEMNAAPCSIGSGSRKENGATPCGSGSATILPKEAYALCWQ
jgi:hypothetical protein